MQNAGGLDLSFTLFFVHLSLKLYFSHKLDHWRDKVMVVCLFSVLAATPLHSSKIDCRLIPYKNVCI